MKIKVALLALTFLTALSVNATDFYGDFDARVGDVTGDGASDILIQQKKRITVIDIDDIIVPIKQDRFTVPDFLLQRQGSAFHIVSPPSSAQYGAAGSLPRTPLRIERNDFNGDGRMDALLKADSALGLAADTLVFASPANDAAPFASTVIDANKALFIRDVAGWVENPSYFNSGLYWQTYVGYFQVAYFNCGGTLYAAYAGDPNIEFCFSGCAYLGWEWVRGQLDVLRFDPTGFSTTALDFLDRLAPHIGADGKFTVPEADAAVLREISRQVLGVPSFGEVTSPADSIPKPRAHSGDMGWVKWIGRRSHWYLLAALLGEIKDLPNLSQIYRVTGKAETQMVLGRLTWPPNNPSGFTQKQFWHNLQDARAYQQAVLTNNWDPYAMTLTILSIRVTPTTMAQGFQFTDPINGIPRPAVSFGPEALPALNRETFTYGIWIHGSTDLPPPPPYP